MMPGRCMNMIGSISAVGSNIPSARPPGGAEALLGTKSDRVAIPADQEPPS